MSPYGPKLHHELSCDFRENQIGLARSASRLRYLRRVRGSGFYHVVIQPSIGVADARRIAAEKVLESLHVLVSGHDAISSKVMPSSPSHREISRVQTSLKSHILHHMP